MLNVVIGERIHELRLKKGLTQEKLADYLNVSHQAISKWENGIVVPDIETLLSLAQLFSVSIDYICGAEKSDIEKATEEIMKKCPYENQGDFSVLMGNYPYLESKLKEMPLNEELLFYSLKYLRHMHDSIMTDEQKDISNELILSIAQRILDISKNDDYRSLANYNMALYYDEQIKMVGEPLPNQKELARKAREYADRVYYKDMHKTFYNMFGAENENEQCIALEKTLKQMINAVNGSIKNLLRFYRWHNKPEKLKSLNNFSKLFANAIVSVDDIIK